MTMTALAPGSSLSMVVPQTQNTAPVLEFRCLFTKDLRQKQKRWQDGKLKYHTFNKRIMVYDERSNFVGDTHWREDSEFDDGEELELDRSGTLVQAGEFLRKREQDLSELIDKPRKEKEERLAARTASSPVRSALHSRSQVTVTPSGSHLRPKPLNAIIGTPTGHYGRAVISTTTPFEERQRLVEEHGGGNENDRPAKRRKPNMSPPSKNGYAQNLFGASMTLSRPPSSAISRYIAARTLSRQPTSTVSQHGTVKPSTNQKLAASVDLTVDSYLDNGEHGSPRQAIRERSPERSSATNRAQKRRPSPPPRSSYASNLTGASLSLSGPREVPSSRVKKAPNLKVGMKEPNKDYARIPSLHSDNGDSSPEILEFESMPVVISAESAPSSSPPLPAMSKMISSPSKVIVAKQKKHPARRIDSSPSSRGSSPPLQQAKRSSTISKPSSTTSNKSASKASKPQSTLRIKAREPKRMMMSMGPPSSRLNSSKKSSLSKQSASRSATAEHSQATVRQDTMLQGKDERLDARLAERHKVPDLEEDNSSPIEDNGINYQNIDALLTRKTLAQSKGNTENVPHSRHVRQENLPGLKLNMVGKRTNSIATETSPTTEARASRCSSKSSSAVVTPVINTLLDNTMDTSFTSDIGNAQKLASSTVTGFEPQDTIKDVFSRTAFSSEFIISPGSTDGITISDSAQSGDTETTLAMLRKENELAQRRAAEEQEKLAKLKEEMEIIKKKADQERLELARLEQERLARVEKEREEREIAERQRLERIEKERTEREKSEKERLERMEMQRIEKERSEKERIERERRESEKNEKERLQKERMDREAALIQEQKLEEARKLEEKRQEMARLEQERLIREAVLKERERIETAHRLREEEEERIRLHQAAIAAKELLKSTENKECREVQNTSATGIGAAQRTRRTVNSTSSALPAHLENGIFSATDRFRRMITTPQIHSDAASRLDSAAGAAHPIAPTKLEPFSSDLGITRSLEPFDHPSKTSTGTDAGSLNLLPEVPILAVAAMTSGVTKAFKLSRPKISETNAAMPSPQRNRGTIAGTNDGNAVLTRPREKAATSGPWSPEAFDLFSWRPPP